MNIFILLFMGLAAVAIKSGDVVKENEPGLFSRWVCFLTFQNATRPLKTCIVIHQLYALSAGEPTYDFTSIHVVAGLVWRYDMDDMQRRAISSVSGYDGKNDPQLFLIKLGKPFRLNNHVGKASIYTGTASISNFEMCTFYGWGNRRDERFASLALLKTYYFTYNDWEKCPMQNSRVFCAGYTGNPPSKVDIGGPLICKYREGNRNPLSERNAAAGILHSVRQDWKNSSRYFKPNVFLDLRTFHKWIMKAMYADARNTNVALSSPRKLLAFLLCLVIS